MKSIFKIINPDFELSSYTGITRKHWIEAAEYLLSGAFSHISKMDDSMEFPLQLGKSYPHNENQFPTEKLEGLCRTLLIAAPLLKENPKLKLNGFKVAEYYRNQITLLIDKNSESYIAPRSTNGGPHQNLVEFGALSVSLFIIPEVLWEPLDQKVKDALSTTMLSYGNGPTINSNWKFFNVFILSFYKYQGYSINESLLISYLNRLLMHYQGNGWYDDSPAYDYYSMWVFQLYGVMWSEFFGKNFLPNIATKFLHNFEDLSEHYPFLFSKNGRMIMYGRSISYRMASASPFPFMGKYGTKDVNLGWMRRIASSTLIQFLKHPYLLKDEVPTLGFYGEFEPAVQIYNCRGSVYFMGHFFLGLILPKDDQFWTEKENGGSWDTYHKYEVINHFAPKSEILITNYSNIGASEIRAWCHEKVSNDWQGFRASENYNRLAYNSNFPWQADDKNGGVAMNYGIKNKNDKWEVLRLYEFQRFEDDIYYRNAVLETNEKVKFNLADIPLPNGILRIDRLTAPVDLEVRLGHYALPEFDLPITTNNKYGATIIDNGKYQLALVPILGWNNTVVIKSEGLHPESIKSLVINALGNYKSGESQYLITLMLWKKSSERWNKDDFILKQNIDLEFKQINVEFEWGKKTIIF